VAEFIQFLPVILIILLFYGAYILLSYQEKKRKQGLNYKDSDYENQHSRANEE
jgi:cbb3-type cytochrome oxidase subunit 3